MTDGASSSRIPPAERPPTPGGDGSSSKVICSICLDPAIEQRGGRTVINLSCGHRFHFDCIGSAFNFKNAMECPNCRQIEHGQWLYAAGNQSERKVYVVQYVLPRYCSNCEDFMEQDDLEWEISYERPNANEYIQVPADYVADNFFPGVVNIDGNEYVQIPADYVSDDLFPRDGINHGDEHILVPSDYVAGDFFPGDGTNNGDEYIQVQADYVANDFYPGDATINGDEHLQVPVGYVADDFYPGDGTINGNEHLQVPVGYVADDFFPGDGTIVGRENVFEEQPSGDVLSPDTFPEAEEHNRLSFHLQPADDPNLAVTGFTGYEAVGNELSASYFESTALYYGSFCNSAVMGYPHGEPSQGSPTPTETTTTAMNLFPLRPTAEMEEPGLSGQ